MRPVLRVHWGETCRCTLLRPLDSLYIVIIREHCADSAPRSSIYLISTTELLIILPSRSRCPGRLIPRAQTPLNQRDRSRIDIPDRHLEKSKPNTVREQTCRIQVPQMRCGWNTVKLYLCERLPPPSSLPHLHTTAEKPVGMGLHSINVRFATSGRAAEITGSWLDHSQDRRSRKGCHCPHGV